jgi:hypothetical protein
MAARRSATTSERRTFQMSPLALKVLLHYYVTPAHFDKNRAHDLEVDAIAQFIRDGLLQARQSGDHDWDAYEITEKGRFYVEAMLGTPLPVQEWRIPSSPFAASNREGKEPQ